MNDIQNTETTQDIAPKDSGRVIRLVAIIVVILTFAGLIFASNAMRRTTADNVWDQATTAGNLDAKNHYIMYTDLMCPYCDVFSRQLLEHWDEFETYLAENDILFEVRLTDLLYYSGSANSRNAAEAVYCAKNEGKFWDFYHEALTSLWDDYHSKGIGSSQSAPPITNMPADYWLEVGHSVGLGNNFDQCVANRDSATAVEETTLRAGKFASGMPTFQFNDAYLSGFGENWGWEHVLSYLNEGLK